jgi:hypothetical protein
MVFIRTSGRNGAPFLIPIAANSSTVSDQQIRQARSVSRPCRRKVEFTARHDSPVLKQAKALLEQLAA